jgi:hypothetical protein
MFTFAPIPWKLEHILQALHPADQVPSRLGQGLPMAGESLALASRPMAIQTRILHLQALWIWSRDMLRMHHLASPHRNAEVWCAESDLFPDPHWIESCTLLFVTHLVFHKPMHYVQTLPIVLRDALHVLLQKWQALSISIAEQTETERLAYPMVQASSPCWVWNRALAQARDFWITQAALGLQTTDDEEWTDHVVHGVTWIRSRSELALWMARRHVTELFFVLRHRLFPRPTDEIQGVVIPLYGNRPALLDWRKRHPHHILLEIPSTFEWILLWPKRDEWIQWITPRLQSVIEGDLSDLLIRRFHVILQHMGPSNALSWLLSSVLFPSHAGRHDEDATSFLTDLTSLLDLVLVLLQNKLAYKVLAAMLHILTLHPYSQALIRTKPTFACRSVLHQACTRVVAAVAAASTTRTTATAARRSNAKPGSAFQVAFEALVALCHTSQSNRPVKPGDLVSVLEECMTQLHRGTHPQTDWPRIKIWVQFLADSHPPPSAQMEETGCIPECTLDSHAPVLQRLFACWGASRPRVRSSGTTLQVRLPAYRDADEEESHMNRRKQWQKQEWTRDRSRDLATIDACLLGSYSQSVSCDALSSPVYPSQNPGEEPLKEEESVCYPDLPMESVSSPSYCPSPPSSPSSSPAYQRPLSPDLVFPL